MSNRFPVLSTVSVILRVTGWGTVIFGGILVLVGLTGTNDALLMVGSGVAFSLWGLMIVAFGEAIGVLFAIEKNTRERGRPEVHDRTVTGRSSAQSGSMENGLASGTAVYRESEGDGVGEADYILVAGEKYRALTGTSEEAFCLGCRSVSAKNDLYYNKDKDTYYHRQCVPGN